MTPWSHSSLRAGDAGGAGRFAAEAAGADLGLGVENFLVAHLPHDAVAVLRAPAGTCRRFTGRLISMALAMVEALRPS